jgi:hypothetical protein
MLIRQLQLLETLMRARALVLVIVGLFATPAATAAPVLLAQGGTMGGTVGKTGKSISGGTKADQQSAGVPHKKKQHKKSRHIRRHSAPKHIQSSEAANPRRRYRWCAVMPPDGIRNCGFETIEQCRRNIVGIGGFCQPNL